MFRKTRECQRMEEFDLVLNRKQGASKKNMPQGDSEHGDLMFRSSDPDSLRINRRLKGLAILFFVNIMWVVSSEILRHVFIEEHFKRPFFVSWLKNCMLSVYLIRYLFCKTVKQPKLEKGYKIMMEEKRVDGLSVEGFETLTSSDNDSTADESRPRRVRFAPHREIRRMPASEAAEARAARKPYTPVECTISCTWTIERHIRWTLFFFGPMWLICSFTYQTSLAFTSVADLNLISSSSSLFVLLFAICIPVEGQKFTLVKAFLVTINLLGVALVSQFSMDFIGATFAQISAVAYALYLTAYASYQAKYGTLDVDLMFGTIGCLTVFVGTPLLLIFDALQVESLYPLPNVAQTMSIVGAGFVGTILADYLWLLGASMTDSLSASLSMTLSIPMSFLADALIRGRNPTFIELIAAIPIALSFIGAALIEGKSKMQRSHERDVNGDTEGLLSEEMDDM